MATKGGRTRERILDAVRELLATQSYENLSIAAITRRAELTRPAFYFHFSSKGAAVAGLLEDLLDEFVAVAAAWYDHPGDDASAGVVEALEATVELWRANAHLIDALIRATTVDAEASALVGQWTDGLGARAADRLRRDIGGRLPADGPSVTALSTFMVGAMFDAMRRDVRDVLAGARPDPEVLTTLVFVWRRVLSD